MNAPEQIAQQVALNYGVDMISGEPIDQAVGWSVEPGDIFGLMVAAAREAQAEPDFKPAGESDYYRTQWEEIREGVDPGELFQIKFYSDGGMYSNYLDITPDQARRILVMLSTEAATK